MSPELAVTEVDISAVPLKHLDALGLTVLILFLYREAVEVITKKIFM